MNKYITISLGDLLNQGVFPEKDLRNFKCNKEKELEVFLASNAVPYEKMGYGKTFLIINGQKLADGIFDIAAFFTIGQKSINIKSLSQKRKRKVLGRIPGRDKLTSVSSYLIGQIGRSDNYSHSDLPGDYIIQQCYEQINIARKQVGGNLLILECRPKMYDLFYKDQGFKMFSEELNDGLLTLYRKL